MSSSYIDLGGAAGSDDKEKARHFWQGLNVAGKKVQKVPEPALFNDTAFIIAGKPRTAERVAEHLDAGAKEISMTPDLDPNEPRLEAA